MATVGNIGCAAESSDRSIPDFLTMGHRFRISAEELERLRIALAHAPASEPLPLNKLEAIRQLLPVLETARARGARFEEMSQVLEVHGIPIGPSVLRTYWYKLHSRQKTEPRKRRVRESRARAGKYATLAGGVGAKTSAVEAAARHVDVEDPARVTAEGRPRPPPTDDGSARMTPPGVPRRVAPQSQRPSDVDVKRGRLWRMVRFTLSLLRRTALRGDR